MGDLLRAARRHGFLTSRNSAYFTARRHWMDAPTAGRVRLDYSAVSMPARKQRAAKAVGMAKKSVKSAPKGPKRESALPAYNCYRLKSWLHYVKLVGSKRYQNWAFRGHADADWKLTSTLVRLFELRGIHPDRWQYQERRSIDKFQERAHHFLRHEPETDDTFQWLALMQHHGAPTRLLDFTWSPYVAAFFALDQATRDAAVWAVNADGITYSDLFKRGKNREEFDPKIRGVLDARYLGEVSDRLYVGEPERKNERLIAQSGTFAVAGSLTRSIDELLSAHRFPKSRIAKFILPIDQRTSTLVELRRMNILNATLFPGLDGLARSISHDLEYHWLWDVTQPWS